MVAPAVTTAGLTKAYGDITALDRVDLDVPSGSVYGLVGPNGAGKTTLLGVLAGLRTPTGGTIDVDAASVSVLPDTPRFDRWLTGREVVDLSRSLAADPPPRGAVDEVLATAGLTEAADRRVKGYSRGMLQRLGLAAAVVGRPDLLLLDEPAAALDPAGRREVLDLVVALSGQSTVVFSSHILDDVQEVCDVIGVLRRGEMVYQGDLEGLLSRYATNRYIVEVTRSADDVVADFEREPWVLHAAVDDHNTITLDVSDMEAARERLAKVLSAADVPVVAVRPDRTSLEEVFLEVTR